MATAAQIAGNAGSAISPLGYGAIQAGANVASSLADQIFNSKDPERIKRLIDFLRRRMGSDVIDPGRQRELSNRIFQAGAGTRQQAAEGVNKRLGLDSGFAQSDILRNLSSDRFGADRDIALLNERLRAQRDTSDTGTIAGLERSIF